MFNLIVDMIGMRKGEIALESLLEDIDQEQKMLQSFIQRVRTP